MCVYVRACTTIYTMLQPLCPVYIDICSAFALILCSMQTDRYQSRDLRATEVRWFWCQERADGHRPRPRPCWHPAPFGPAQVVRKRMASNCHIKGHLSRETWSKKPFDIIIGCVCACVYVCVCVCV